MDKHEYDSSSLFEEVQQTMSKVGNYHPFTSNMTTVTINLCPEGHRGDALQLEYLAGVFVTYCKTCGDKIVVEKIPGELPKIKIRAMLLESLLGNSIDIEELSEAKKNLEKERDSLEQAESNLHLIIDMLTKGVAV